MLHLGVKKMLHLAGCKNKKTHAFRVFVFLSGFWPRSFFRLGVLHDAMEAPSSTLGVHREKSPVAGADPRGGNILAGRRCVARDPMCVELKSGRGLWWGGELKGWWFCFFCGVGGGWVVGWSFWVGVFEARTNFCLHGLRIFHALFSGHVRALGIMFRKLRGLDLRGQLRCSRVIKSLLVPHRSPTLC